MDNSIGILGRVVGIPLKEDVIGYLGDVRKNLGRSSSAGHVDSSLDRASICGCSARTGPRWLENRYERTEIHGIK